MGRKTVEPPGVPAGCLKKVREAGLRATIKRKAIPYILSAEKGFLSPEQVFRRLKKKFKRASFPSVYRNLETFHGLGILLKVQRPDRRLYYALCRASGERHHHHIVCTRCGAVEEFYDCGLIDRRKLRGYEITGHSLQLEGMCPVCLKDESS